MKERKIDTNSNVLGCASSRMRRLVVKAKKKPGKVMEGKVEMKGGNPKVGGGLVPREREETEARPCKAESSSSSSQLERAQRREQVQLQHATGTEVL